MYIKRVVPKLKRRPGSAKRDLAFADFLPQGKTTVEQLISILNTYTHAPIQPTYTVGPLVPDLDMLGADINQSWNLPQGFGYKSGDIDPNWTVQQLAGDIDRRVAAEKSGAVKTR